MLKCSIHCVWLFVTSRLAFESSFLSVVYSDIESSLGEPESGFEVCANYLLLVLVMVIVEIPIKRYLSLCKIHVEISHHETIT